jgi:NADPH-dependent 2,4-dienoyl-CoA reductase/sulfur reductase-like enzyme
MSPARVIVVGAGPAGTRCVEALVAAGLRPTLVEEGRRDGGQIYRRQPEGFTRSYETLYGTESGKAEALHRAFDALRSRIDYRPETLAWNIEGRELHVVRAGHAEALPFDALVICSGATDRLMPVKGWNLAGTYSLGGAQIALKSQACAIGGKVAFMGTGPLLYLVASQYVKAGAAVAAVLDTSPFRLRLAALPRLIARPAMLRNGLAISAVLRRAGVAVHTGITPLEIRGTGEGGVGGVSFRDASGRAIDIACDAVALGYHLRPETQLADLARCEFIFDAATRQWIPRRDDDGRSSVAGVYLAGDGAHVLGADAAEAAGRLAALAVLKDLKHPVDEGAMHALRGTLAKMRRFAEGLAQAFPWPAQQARDLPDEAVLCRCEAITAGEVRHAVQEKGACEANRAKAFTRVGMGRCQGRYCGNAAAEVIAQAAGVPLESVGRLRGQAPVKPLSMATE